MIRRADIADTIEEITRVIAREAAPTRVILIGSRARGDARPDSDIDLVVEWNTTPEDARRRGHAVYGLFPKRNFELNVIARAAGQIEAAANDPGTVDWDIVRQGKVLYSATGDCSLTVPPARVRERQPPESLRDWVDRARHDLEVSRFTTGHGKAWDWVAFLAQQSAEQYLKALLVQAYVRPPRVHDLVELLGVLSRAGTPLTGVDAECELLSRYAVDSRYGPRLASEAEARAALAAAARIAAAAEAQLRAAAVPHWRGS